MISGISWLAIGSYLMVKGLNWIVIAMAQPEPSHLIKWLASFAGSIQQGALVLICASLLVGFIKGRTLLARTVKRVISHLQAQKPPVHFLAAYDRKYFIILGSMIGLGLLMRWLALPPDIHGGIDVAIGSALINGAMLYFREALIPTQKLKG